MLAKLAKRAKESYVVTAIPVGPMRVYVAFNVIDADGGFIGSAVIDVDVTTMASTIMYESERTLIDYVVDAEGWQCILMDGCVVEIEPRGKPVETTKKVPTGLYRMALVADRRIAICGDSGQVQLYAKRKFKKLDVETGATDPKYQEDLRSIHFATPTRGYAVGNYGVFLKGDAKRLAPATKANPFATDDGGRSPVLAVYETKRGDVLLGTDGGPAVVFANGKLEKLAGLPSDAQVFAMVEFNGDELWATSENQLYVRKGKKLRKRPEEAGGYRMEANADLMASSCGSFIYVFDRTRWTRVRVNPNPKKLVERLKLDF